MDGSENDQPVSGLTTPSKKQPQASISSNKLQSLVSNDLSVRSGDEDLPDQVALILNVTDGEGASPMKEASVGQLFVEQTAKLDLSESKHANDTGSGERPQTAPKMTIDVDIASEPIDEAMPSVPCDPSPYKRSLRSPSEEDSAVNSTNTTPFAKVLPVKAVIVAPSPKNTTASSKLRSKSVTQGQHNSFRGSFPTDKDSEAAPPLGTLDRKLSPSEKFRSFMKSFTPSRSVSLDGVDEKASPGIDLGAPPAIHISGGSAKSTGGGSRKTLGNNHEKMWNNDLKARIAKVQEEQWKFRQSQKLKTLSGKGSFKNESTKEKETKVNKKLKMNKNGVAPIYNTYSIRAGLRKGEFRETLEAGAAVIKKLKSTESVDAGEDSFNVYSLPQLGTGGSVDLAAERFHKEFAHTERNVTMTGEGYMSEEDWRITSTDAKKKSIRIPQSSRDDKFSDSKDLHASSNLNLEQFMEAALREQSALNVNTSDCADVSVVPLSYLQSSNLIEKRFGWETKDHSVKAEPHTRQKSWMALRSAVQFTGAFNMIAAAAAASPHPHERALSASPSRPAPEPSPNAPMIVVEATPVTDFVAGLVQKNRMLASGSFDSTASPENSPDRSLSPERKRPAFVISKETPQRPVSPERSVSPPVLRQIVQKEDAKSAKIKANAKDFHDHYSGLLWRDSSRNLIWQGTEEIILGTQRSHTNNILNTRSDMRWAGKTLNMFRPWSAARQEDVIDQFRHQQPMSTRPGSPNSPDKLPTIQSSKYSSGNSGRNSPVFGFTDADFAHGAARSSMTGSIGGSATTGSVNAGGNSINRSNYGKTSHHVQNHAHDGAHDSVRGGVHGTIHSGNAGGDASVGKNGHVTYGHHGMHNVDQSDAGSVLTMNSNFYGSRTSHTSRRAPLLINLVKTLPPN